MGAVKELPKYKCHKEVWALKISTIEVDGKDNSATITPADEGYAPFKTDPGWADRFDWDANDPGYYVVYSNGFKSWSPTRAFEEGYTKI